MDEGHPERPHLVGQIGVVGDHHHHRHVQLTAAVAPEQVQQTVVLGRRHQGDAFGFGGLGQPEVDAERLGHLRGELLLQLGAGGGQAGEVEDRPLHEDPAGLLGGVLIQRDDVGPGIGQEGRDRGHQSGAVVAAEQ